RHLLERMVQSEGGVTVGQAADAPRTLTMVSDVKPDVAIIDCNLPYIASRHTLPLSRVGGLDTAQRITREIPGTEAVLLGNLDTIVMDHPGFLSDSRTYSMKSIENNAPLVMRDLGRTAPHPGYLVFANVEARAQELPQQIRTTVSDKLMLFGVLAMALGGFLIITWVAATIGAAIALAGITAIAGAMGGNLTTSLYRRLSGKRQRRE
ncbi:MAG: hypothetical protein Q7T04_04150, partial [Dehalococcoidia bacterium]|nr:hypothetical protein [Dehalococcoidia bacterium]